MGELLLIAWRNARSSLGRTMMTLVAITFGVAFLAGTLAVSDTLARNTAALFTSQYDSVDVLVRGQEVAFGVREDLDEAMVEEIASVPGVAADVGVVTGMAQPMTLEGEPLGSAAQPGIGHSWIDDPGLQDVPLSAGAPPSGSEEMVLDTTTAQADDVQIGERIQLATSTEVRDMTVVGIADTSSGTGSALSWVAADEAQALLGTPGTYQEIYVAAEEGTTPDELVDAVVAVVPASAEVLTGAEAADQAQAQVEAVFGFIQVILLVFVAIGLIVCAFIVYNTFAVLTAQRTKQLATLRALGCSQRQVTGATLAEGLMLGVVGSALGILLGFLGTSGLLWLIAALGLGEISGGVAMGVGTIAAAFAAGLVVTLIGSYPAARAAGRMPPVSAMRSSAPTGGKVTVGRIMFGLVALVLGVMLIGIGATAGYPEGLAPVGLGFVVLLVGIGAWTGLIITELVEVASRPIRRVFGIAGDLAGRNSLRDVKRTTVTAGSLALGLALVSSMAVLTSSLKATLDDSAQNQLTADVIVLPVVGYTTMAPEVTDRVRGVPGIASATPILFDAAVIDAQPTFVTGVDPAGAEAALDLQMQSGDASTLADGQLLVAATVAQRAGLREGQETNAIFANSDGLVQLRVGGIFEDNVYAGFYLLDESRFEELTAKSNVYYVYATAEDDADPQAVKDDVTAAISDIPNTQAMTIAEYTAFQDELVDQALAGIYFMLLFAVIVAVVGVANTIALSVSERGSEIGMLRAIGMPRRQVSRMVRVEAALTAIAGGIMGVVIGLYLGLSLRQTLSSVGFEQLSIPLASIAGFFVFTVVAAALSAWLPARRAAQQNIIESIRG